MKKYVKANHGKSHVVHLLRRGTLLDHPDNDAGFFLCWGEWVGMSIPSDVQLDEIPEGDHMCKRCAALEARGK